ncbi:putative disease resistance RPP13-like protein 1 [Setaria viridis]|uniref:NB-ARC domain-containing protein n=1 Tax=Setaria viridis TaxID=4556 RepID=A0A4U6VYH4_SETVI|nr:uncharacterized protein LOC117845713 [Setaria viridis]TKW30087.1 hypothetical protein SEVIR_2G011200v2 [Setaria viridis]
MESFLSAVLGELASRSINFFISRSSKPKVLEVEDRLKRALLRAQVIVNEATGRNITNQAMLQQLDMLRNAMHQGCYMLDTFRYQYHGVEDAKDQVVSHSLSLSKVSSLKGIGSSNRKTLLLEQLQEALDNLSSMILDVKELVVILPSYPRLNCQPYSMHLQLSNCMFGRQMESELVINFLLHTQRHGSEELDILPIVGPGKVGKSTLVAHVCKNERVRDHFSEILFLRDHDFTDDNLSIFRGCATRQQNRTSNSNKDRGWLVVVDLVGDLNEDAWNVLYSSCKQRIPSTSKIIIASRSAKITKFATTHALNLKYLSSEAFWYFFKTITFGSIDPKMHPRFVHVAMEIANKLERGIIGANMLSRLLRDNFDIHFWCKVLAFLRGVVEKHVSKFGVHPFHLINQNKPVHLGRLATPFEDLIFYCEHQISSQEDFPKIRLEDVMYGSVTALGKLEFLGWISPIPPYYSYVVTCEVRELKRSAAKRKRSVENGTTLC